MAIWSHYKQDYVLRSIIRVSQWKTWDYAKLDFFIIGVALISHITRIRNMNRKNIYK